MDKPKSWSICTMDNKHLSTNLELFKCKKILSSVAPRLVYRL